MQEQSLYEKAHLMVAAIRLLTYKNGGSPPTITACSNALSISMEEALFLMRKMEENGILQGLSQAGTIRLILQDHMKIEALPKTKGTDRLDAELEAFQSRQQTKSDEIKAFQKEQKAKQKALFEKLNQSLGTPKKDTIS